MSFKISFDGINKSLKFSAFIASGALFILSLVQIMINNTLFWELVAGFSGLVFISLLISVLWKLLKPVIKAWKKKKTRTKGKRQGIGTFIRKLFEHNTYFKIMAIIWFVVLLVGLEIAIRFTGLIEAEQSRIRVFAQFGYMIITASTALFIFNVSKTFKKKP